MAEYTTEEVVHKTGLSRRRLQSWVHHGILRAQIPGPRPKRWQFTGEELRIAGVLAAARANGLSLARLRLVAGMLRHDVHRLEDHDWMIVINPEVADLEQLQRPTLAISTEPSVGQR